MSSDKQHTHEGYGLIWLRRAHGGWVGTCWWLGIARFSSLPAPELTDAMMRVGLLILDEFGELNKDDWRVSYGDRISDTDDRGTIASGRYDN